MFRFFRRGKKKKKESQEENETITKGEVTSASSVSGKEEVDISKTEKLQTQIPEYTSPEATFEERFSQLPKIISEGLSHEIVTTKPEDTFLPFIETVYDLEDTPYSFISPEGLEKASMASSSIDSTVETIYSTEKLPPISLEEKIEGALFAVGRPIHASELIEFLQEESPIVKRALRRLQRKRKRTSPIMLTEISKDRWVLQLNPIYHEYFRLLIPEKFLSEEERRVLTEIAYRQPISIALVKKMVRKIGPIKITAICKGLEERGYIIGEKRARSFVYTTTPKFAKDFGFDNESRRLKLQMLWRLKRLMGDYEVEEEEEEEEMITPTTPKENETIDQASKIQVSESAVSPSSDSETSKTEIEREDIVEINNKAQHNGEEEE
ncbi:MAG: SMC-Scp complex subunit ScpB [Candidatus Hodarchaeales archaeon]